MSNDNPYSKSIFRTLKYRPEYPEKPFATLAAARTWVGGFVDWYNHRHLHSSIKFVTPDQRHKGEDVAILAQLQQVYALAKEKHPERWSGYSGNCIAWCTTWRSWRMLASLRREREIYPPILRHADPRSGFAGSTMTMPLANFTTALKWDRKQGTVSH